MDSHLNVIPVINLDFLVYVRASSSTAFLFSEYRDLIQPLANVDNIQMFQEKLTTEQNEYITIATTSDYTLYFKSK